MLVSVVIPAWNEEESISRVLAELAAAPVDEVLVVDGASTDRTAEIARDAGAEVIIEPRRGYGRACATGAERAHGEVVVFLDADGADDPRRVGSLLAPLRNGQTDMVLGSRLAGKLQAGSMPWHQKTGNRLCAALISARFRQRLTDLSPFRAVFKNRLAELNLQEMTYGYPTEMIVKAARRGWRLVEVPVGYRARLGGRSKISGTLKGSVLATYYILKVIARYGWEKE